MKYAKLIKPMAHWSSRAWPRTAVVFRQRANSKNSRQFHPSVVSTHQQQHWKNQCQMPKKRCRKI